MMRRPYSARQVTADAFVLARQWRARGCELSLRYVNTDPHVQSRAEEDKRRKSNDQG
jgi:hypothetical protein